MMKEEFEALTNFAVTPNEYKDIEAKYMDNASGSRDKTGFCKLWVENGGIKDILQARNDGNIELPPIKRYTNTELMNIAVEKAKQSGEYGKAEKILDYFLPEEYKITKLTDYEFDFHAIADFGGSEGIYLDCWLKGKFDGSGSDYCKMGTFKTLRDDLEGMKIMAELGGILNYFLSSFVNQNIKCFTPDEELKQQAMYEAARQLDSYLLSERYQTLWDKGKNGNLTAGESAALQAEIEEIERKLPNRGNYEPGCEAESEADQDEEM
jgi:hypothetical protein